MIAVLTGPVGSGKTTALARTFADDGLGVLQPVVDGRRHVADLSTGERRLLEADADVPEPARVRVGRFSFSAEAVSWARAALDRALRDGKPGEWVVVDEVGPLELGGDGLASAVRAVARGSRGPATPNALLVVREGLVGAVAATFGIEDPVVVRLGDALPDGRRLPLSDLDTP